MSKQPAALRLADALACLEATGQCSDSVYLTEWSQQQADAAAEELRRLQAVNAELLEALKAVLPELRGIAMVSSVMRNYVDACESAIAKATGEA